MHHQLQNGFFVLDRGFIFIVELILFFGNIRIPFNMMVAMIFMALDTDVSDNVKLYVWFLLVLYLPENW
jgi:hypothetical protein